MNRSFDLLERKFVYFWNYKKVVLYHESKWTWNVQPLYFFSRIVIFSECNNEIFLLKNNTTKIDKNWQGTKFKKTTKLDSSFWIWRSIFLNWMKKLLNKFTNTNRIAALSLSTSCCENGYQSTAGCSKPEGFKKGFGYGADFEEKRHAKIQTISKRRSWEIGGRGSGWRWKSSWHLSVAWT